MARGTVADYAGGAVVEVEHRREAEVDAVCAQFGRQHVAGLARQVPGLLRMGVPDLAEAAHRRQACESFLEALHAAAFVVDADQEPP